MPVTTFERAAPQHSGVAHRLRRFMVEIHGINGTPFPEPIEVEVEDSRAPDDVLAELLILKTLLRLAKEGKLPVSILDVEEYSAHFHHI